MRILVLVVGFLIVAAPAWAKPKVAVAPFKNDKNNKVSEALSDALAGSVKVTEPAATGKAVDKLKLGKELDVEEARKLAKKLEVDAVVQGKLEKDGTKQTLKIAIFIKGKDEAVRFTVQFTKITDKFREDVSNLIVKKLGDVEEKAEKPEPVAEDNPPDDGEPKIKKKKKKRKTDEDETPGPRWNAARIDVGGFGGVRKLTYSSNMVSPRPVGTRNTAAHVEGEIYPLAFDGKKNGAAGLGIAGEFEKTLGLSINIPAGAVPINQGYFSIGGRYRIHAGPTLAIIVGTDFMKKHYIADRSKLPSPGDLDAPDVDYTAIAPNVGVAKMVTPTLTVFGRAGAMLIMNAGPIAERENYGAASVFGFDIKAGTDIAFSERIGLRLAGGFNQITFKFKGNGDLAMARGVVGAADRNFGLAATLGVTY